MTQAVSLKEALPVQQVNIDEVHKGVQWEGIWVCKKVCIGAYNYYWIKKGKGGGNKHFWVPLKYHLSISHAHEWVKQWSRTLWLWWLNNDSMEEGVNCKYGCSMARESQHTQLERSLSIADPASKLSTFSGDSVIINHCTQQQCKGGIWPSPEIIHLLFEEISQT